MDLVRKARVGDGTRRKERLWVRESVIRETRGWHRAHATEYEPVEGSAGRVTVDERGA
jgi:hypothetical protein